MRWLSTRSPRLAIVEYADAISSGVTAEVPSTMLGTFSSGERMPSRCATSAMAPAPTSTATWQKTAFVESTVACSRVLMPGSFNPALLHSQSSEPPKSMTCGVVMSQ